MTRRAAAVGAYACLALAPVFSLIASYFVRDTELVDLVMALGFSAFVWQWMRLDAREREDQAREALLGWRLMPIAILLFPVHVFATRGARDGGLLLLRSVGWAAVAYVAFRALRSLVIFALT